MSASAPPPADAPAAAAVVHPHSSVPPFELIEGDEEKGVVMGGMRITTRKGPILSSAEIEQWQDALGLPELPEMVFGKNRLRIHNPRNDFVFELNAFDALRELAPTAHGVEVVDAKRWKERVGDSVKTVHPFDWTFSTPYAGTGKSASDPRGCTVWTQTDEDLPMSMLQRPDPILFFDELVLYEDELHDHGESMLTVKMRAMPTFLFALMRFFLRVDGVLARSIETRIFFRYTDEHVLVNRVVREANWRDLTNNLRIAQGGGMGPDAPVDYGTADVVVQQLPIVAQCSWLAQAHTRPRKAYTIMFVVEGTGADRRILLGMKNRGFGAGRYNGFGGKVEPNETVEEAAKREMLEESGVTVDEARHIGMLQFAFENDDKLMECHVYEAVKWHGDATGSDEMTPAWFPINEVPFDKMWPDDILWFHHMFADELFIGYFQFRGEETIVSHQLRVTNEEELRRTLLWQQPSQPEGK